MRRDARGREVGLMVRAGMGVGGGRGVLGEDVRRRCDAMFGRRRALSGRC